MMGNIPSYHIHSEMGDNDKPIHPTTDFIQIFHAFFKVLMYHQVFLIKLNKSY